MPKRWFVQLYIACALIFVAAAVLVRFDKGFSDNLHWDMRPYHPIIQQVTQLGDGWVVFPLCILAAFICWVLKRENWKMFALAVVSCGVSGIFVQALKIIFGRPRPYLYDDIANHHINFNVFHWLSSAADFRSFPSGHTNAIFSVVWIILQLELHWVLKSLIASTAVTVALTRVALGKHFIADVIAGAAIGIAFAQLMLDLYAERSRLRARPTSNTSITNSPS